MCEYTVNLYVEFDSEEYDIVPYHTYRGRTTNTTYVDGESYTEWGVFSGTLEECQEYVKEHSV